MKRSTASSIVWAMIESGSLSVMSFIVLLVLARMLTPGEFGIAAIALSIVQIAAAVAEMMFHDAIVHRDGLTREHVASAHSVTLVLGAVLTVVVIASAPLVAAAFEIAELSPILMASAPSILLTAIGAVPVAYLRRNMDFRAVALRMLIGRLLGGLAAIVAAVVGLGVWSLVLQQVATTAFASLAVLMVGRASWPGFAGPSAAIGLLRFAATTLVVNLLWGNAAKMFLLGCGFALSQAGVGQISLAMRIVDTLASIVATAQSKVALSLFSQVFRTTGTIRDVYVAGSRLSTYLVAPMFAGLALVARDVVAITVGEQWMEIVPLVQIFAAGHAVRSLAYLGGSTLTATGRPSANLIVSLVDLVTAMALLAALGGLGSVGVAEAWVLRLVVTIPLIGYLLARYAGLEATDLMVGVYGAVVATIAMVIAVLPLGDALAANGLWLRLSASVFVGAVVYGGAVWLIEPKLFAIPRGVFGTR